MGISLVKWKCEKCGEEKISDPFEHHTMDICGCGSSGLDLETYCTRFMGDIKILKKIPREFEKERLNKVWTNYGKDEEFPEGKTISISDMSDEHLLVVYELDYTSERIKWLVKREMAHRGLKWVKVNKK